MTAVENFNLFDFFAEIWKDVNTACVGHHNFILQTDMENPNWVRVIDLRIQIVLLNQRIYLNLKFKVMNQ
jgi:hypothetical protein